MLPEHLYVSVREDESWHVRAGNAELRERRSEQGQAFTSVERGAIRIRASDDLNRRLTNAFSAPSEAADRLRSNATESRSSLRETLINSLGDADEALVRLLRSSRFVESAASRDISETTTATLRLRTGNRTLELTTDLAHATDDLATVHRIRAGQALSIDPMRFPIVWRGGTGAVLLHEAIGHPAEQGIFTAWPEWLSVFDEPFRPVDDAGRPVVRRNLSAGEQPASFRREDFRSAPMLRMSRLLVEVADHVVDVPENHIEVWLVGGGFYDALSDTVRIEVSGANLVGADIQSLEPFELTVPRLQIPIHLRGAWSEPAEYPGVICSEAGQRVRVESVAPDLLTAPFAA